MIAFDLQPHDGGAVHNPGAKLQNMAAKGFCLPGLQLLISLRFANVLSMFTGLQGEHPHRIWQLIYSQSCFSDVDSLASCPEKRIFYRLISGTAHSPSEATLQITSVRVLPPNSEVF